jgi:ATP-dependent helicase/nuclease subunit A
LQQAREELEDERRLEEGRAVACALLHARRDRAMRWSDVMLLVKKRSHLSAYETALREAGIPFVSDRKGGLLDALEVLDLVALLTFLITPGDNRALAHVLKSPIVGAGDDDLIALAMRTEDNWWHRLMAARDDASPALRYAAGMLNRWLAIAPHLPVHDLLDRIMHEGRLATRYAQAAPTEMRAQVLGNIDAFIELALNLDAGRYPSLPKFIAALNSLQQSAESDAPDEAGIDPNTDAVRILTIHGAKGLEAPVVVLLDANHSEPARDDIGILCDWPPHELGPVHFSAFGRKSERGAARDAYFSAEEEYRRQEDWNLLYVAATRAKELLILSGVATPKGNGGVAVGSWYERMLHAPKAAIDDIDIKLAARQQSQDFTLHVFDPPNLAPLSLNDR